LRGKHDLCLPLVKTMYGSGGFCTMTIFIIESAVLCLVFTIIVVTKTTRDPLASVMSYPPEIRKRVSDLPQYQDKFAKIERKNIGVKLCAAAALAIALAFILYCSGQRTFLSALLYSFGLFSVGNLYDLIVLDRIWFCRSKKVRIPGTEDMDRAYGEKFFHFKAFARGLVIGLTVSLVAAGLPEIGLLIFA
jgi:hypothetical protein